MSKFDIFGNPIELLPEEVVEEKKKKNWFIWDVIMPSINYIKNDQMNPENEKDYMPYLINHSLSGSHDAVIDANEMNRFSFLDHRLQYDYFRYSLRKKKRYAGWLKDKVEDLQSVMKYFGYSSVRAKEALNILTKEQLKEIKEKTNTEGKK